MISQEQLVNTAITHSEAGVMVDVRNLVKSYHHKTVVKSVSFNVRRGEIFGVLGPNGVGKTTTLEMIEGIRTPDSGTHDFGNEMHIARNASPSPLNARAFFWRGISTTSAL